MVSRSSRSGLAALAVLAAAAPALAVTFTPPPFFGQPNSTYQEWQSFTSTAGPNAPTAKTNATGTANWFDRTAATDGAFLTGGHVYSFSGTVNPQIDVPLPSLGQAGLTQVVLQAEVLGNPLDVTQFRAQTAGGPLRPPTSVAFTTAASTSPMGGNTYDYTVTWSNLPATTAYALTYTPGQSSSSQVAVRVDTVSAVPEPASLAAAAAAAVGGGLLRRRRAAV